MIEVIVAYLADRGLALNDYPSALGKVFAFIANDDFETAIAFADYYNPATCATTGAPVRIWDPVNNKNNVSALYTQQNKEKIVEAALDAGDAIDSARRSATNARASSTVGNDSDGKSCSRNARISFVRTDRSSIIFVSAFIVPYMSTRT